MALPIPEKYVPEINKLRNLSDSASDELVRALAASNITARPEDMTAHIAADVPSIPIADLTGIVDVIYALYQVREYSPFSEPRFLKELVDGIKINSPGITEDEVPRIRERFQRLLSIETLTSISKAITLQHDGERLFCDAKIISDIRPIFRDVKSKPVAAIVAHTLKLGYHEGAGHHEFFLVLDDEDINSLYDVIVRARNKSASLSGLLKEWNLPRLGL
jgi:hypothetical protein